MLHQPFCSWMNSLSWRLPWKNLVYAENHVRYRLIRFRRFNICIIMSQYSWTFLLCFTVHKIVAVVSHWRIHSILLYIFNWLNSRVLSIQLLFETQITCELELKAHHVIKKCNVVLLRNLQHLTVWEGYFHEFYIRSWIPMEPSSYFGVNLSSLSVIWKHFIIDLQFLHCFETFFG